MVESGENKRQEVLVEELSQEESKGKIWQRRERVGREEGLRMQDGVKKQERRWNRVRKW